MSWYQQQEDEKRRISEDNLKRANNRIREDEEKVLAAKTASEAAAKKKNDEDMAEDERIRRIRIAEGEAIATASRPVVRQPPMSDGEAMTLFALGFLVLLAVLFFMLGYASGADIKSGDVSKTWSPSALVRALPALIALGAAHVAGLRIFLGTTASVIQIIVMVCVTGIVGPERAVVIGFFTLIAMIVAKAQKSRQERSKLVRFMSFSLVSLPWLVVIGGATIGFVGDSVGLEGLFLLRLPYGILLMPIEWSGVGTLMVMAFLCLVTVVGVGLMSGSVVHFLAPLGLTLPMIFGLAFTVISLQGIPRDLVLASCLALSRVLFVGFPTTALLWSPEQRNWNTLFSMRIPPMVAQNKTLFLGLLAMIALEVANISGLLASIE